ncbi:winged helix-turn-helix domain-containing protein [Streptomyces sp. NBC_01387]|uniref:ArsR/SmtB family transcription factor n=1 Tax=unclassified Streptomyces TaxID=2593676 RepID=UPI002024B5CA|nr:MULTISPECIES: winged helix-turn-helix domain-containing protein [unclassified Streptomyces]MCX4551235.1 winged helix-turn-helix domain-containing protein [Streptomyces sp. NBC_01500]WSC22631.1 winged helix-turn-helix domain-containing protein [Streptomyces sp. NBC_01766]WSV56475.1 winged helix-turn-helix domain-containing protein [Streptomyces sp. NBC_01014]
MASNKPVRNIDTRSLRALAHPLRVRIMESLRRDGPATSTRLAEEFGESTGTVSWHLRNLAEHHFIVEETERGTKRERWWRAVDDRQVLDSAELAKDPAARGAFTLYVQELLQLHFQRAAGFAAQEWPPGWERAGTLSNWDDLRLTPEQLRALNDELMAVIDKYYPAPGEEPEPGALPVSVQLQSFPRIERKN